MNSAIGSAQTGPRNDRTNDPNSILGAIARSQTTTRIETNDVDHGSDAAIKMAAKSAILIQTTESRNKDGFIAADELAGSTLMFGDLLLGRETSTLNFSYGLKRVFQKFWKPKSRVLRSLRT